MAHDVGSHDVGVRIERGKGATAVVWLEREPVNSMSLEFWRALADALSALERDPKVRGVIFASGLRRAVFTAGNDIKELYAPRSTWRRYREFWLTQTKFLARLLETRLATVCAIRGACPAGGCVVALCCDYRVQTTSGSFGLNEVALGISVPKYWAELFLYRCTDRVKGERLLQLGTLVRPTEAQSLGLIDEVVGEGALLAAAESALDRYVKVPSGARAQTKRTIRAHFSAEWSAYAEQEAKGGWKLLNEPATVEALGGVLARLSGGAAHKSKL